MFVLFYCTGNQERNHVFKVQSWGVQFLGVRYYYFLLQVYTQFGAVGYIITLYSSKSYT